MGLRLVVVDAFTDQAFAGNPAAVAVVDEFPPDPVMQIVAREMNLSETAFLARRLDGDFDLRWFTPEVEVDLCGHATLASAHVIGGPARFHTRSGVLACTVGEGGLIEMDFPADPPTPVADLPDLRLGRVAWAGRGRFDTLVELDEADAVRSLKPDLGAIAELDSRALIVTAAGDRPGIDCVSRVFGPNVGIAEDPVTGSAHCTLAEFWGEQTGRTTLVGEQASARGGIVFMRRVGGRVILGGRAVAVSEVQILADLAF
jgi:predicted PhzF superfamily epimerase YddE/YHI9